MAELMFKQIFDEKLLDKEFCKYLEKRLEDNVVDELQIEIQILIGNIVPYTNCNLTMIKLKISSNTIISIVIIAGAIISYFLLVNFII